MKTQVLFYKGDSWISKIVKFFIKAKYGFYPKYTHVAFLFNGYILVETGLFSSYKMKILKQVYNPKDYDLVTLILTEDEQNILFGYTIQNIGVKYDLRECLRLFFRSLPDNKNRRDCVETVVDSLNYIKYIDVPDDLFMDVDELYPLLISKAIKEVN